MKCDRHRAVWLALWGLRAAWHAPGLEITLDGTQIGRTFEGLARTRYCSVPCRAKADYERHAAARRQQKRDYRAARKAAE